MHEDRHAEKPAQHENGLGNAGNMYPERRELSELQAARQAEGRHDAAYKLQKSTADVLDMPIIRI